MPDAMVTARLELRWRPVVDERGHAHLEARWVDASESVVPRVTHAA